jgi:tetratricopeptide (TPR) repeat protein
VTSRRWEKHIPALAAIGAALFAASVSASAQIPKHPENLQVLPKTLATDSLLKIMDGVADALGVSCGFCHVGGDNDTFDSTNFKADRIPKKGVARQMFRLTMRLNDELVPAINGGRRFTVPVTCMTCHRGATRPVVLEDSLAAVLASQGVDSVVATYLRIRERYAGQMVYDLTDWPLRSVARRLTEGARFRDAIKVLEVDARLFPAALEVALQLGLTYEKAGERQLAIMQFHKVLSLNPRNGQAGSHLRALTTEPKPPSQRG